MTPFLIDIIMLAILAFCVWQGLRKGLILTIGGIVIVFLSAFLAGRVADAFAEDLSNSLHPIMMWVADDAIEEAMEGRGRLSEINDRRVIEEITGQTYEILGIHPSEANKMIPRTIDAITQDGASVTFAISSTLLYALSHMLLGIFGFILFMVGLTLLLHFLASIFKLPVLKTLDKAGGTVAGFLQGFLILSVIGWASRFLGIIINYEMVAGTFFLRFFINNNILSGILGF